MTVRFGPVLRRRALRSLIAGTALFVAGLSVPALTAQAAGVGPEGPATSVSPQTASQASSQASSFVGYVFRNADGNLATKVRAIGSDGIVCGTGTVQRLSSGDGLYRIDVVSADVREGCPAEGQGLGFRLLYGSVDDGSFAITSQVVRFAAGKTQVVSLTPNPSHAADGWLGELPTERGAEAHLVWVGADGTPIDEALALLDVEVYRASHYDAATDRWQSYTPGGPSFRQTYLAVGYGDVVLVRVK